MNEMEFLGSLVIGLISLFGLIGYFVSATVKLTKVLTKLESTLNHISEHSEQHTARLDAHEARLHVHDLEINTLKSHHRQSA